MDFGNGNLTLVEIWSTWTEEPHVSLSRSTAWPVCGRSYGLAGTAGRLVRLVERLAGWQAGSCRLARLASWFVLDGAAGTAGLAPVRSGRSHVGSCCKVQVEADVGSQGAS